MASSVSRGMSSSATRVTCGATSSKEMSDTSSSTSFSVAFLADLSTASSSASPPSGRSVVSSTTPVAASSAALRLRSSSSAARRASARSFRTAWSLFSSSSRCSSNRRIAFGTVTWLMRYDWTSLLLRSDLPAFGGPIRMLRIGWTCRYLRYSSHTFSIPATMPSAQIHSDSSWISNAAAGSKRRSVVRLSA